MYRGQEQGRMGRREGDCQRGGQARDGGQGPQRTRRDCQGIDGLINEEREGHLGVVGHVGMPKKKNEFIKGIFKERIE